jgi:hypothetical protein
MKIGYTGTFMALNGPCRAFDGVCNENGWLRAITISKLGIIRYNERGGEH